jgi:rSAM/selenodomain-associated transferase 2
MSSTRVPLTRRTTRATVTQGGDGAGDARWRPRRTLWLSVVVPTLDEGGAIVGALESADAQGVERIVVDGGSADATIALARAHADLVLVTERGRALQMNAGARAAAGEVLLFLHADTTLPQGYAAHVAAALADPGVVAGRFDVRLDARGPLYACLGRLISLRSRLTGIATGDQAIFVRRAVFEAVGGFPPEPIMEDVALSRALRRRGRIACLRAAVRTSARRWQRDGAVRTILLMWALRLAYYAGVPTRILARAYRYRGAAPPASRRSG